MGSRSFRLNVLFRTGLLFASAFALAWATANTDYYAVMLLITVLIALQIWSLMEYVQSTNRELARFLLSVEHADMTPAFARAGMGAAFDELGQALRAVLDRVQKARAEREEQAQMLRVLIEHVPVALLSFRDDGKVDVFNTAARRLFGVAQIGKVADLAAFGESLPETVAALVPGRPQLVKAAVHGTVRTLKAAMTQVALGGRPVRIVSLQSIENELEARELAAWQDLIRVLTHEMMNSLTPIASLAGTTAGLTADLTGRLPEDPALREAAADIGEAVDAIARRAVGLQHFVQSYRQLTRAPVPEIRSLEVARTLNRLERLMGPDLAERGVRLTVDVRPPGLEIAADPELLDQALINLLRNAGDAVKGRPDAAIAVVVRRDEGAVLVEVTDNGPGIPPEALDKIFVPFFTTKRHGSGIGLSVVRQIMLAHGGTVAAGNAPAGGASFVLRFR